ncbi:hypothetical protein BJV74DRAFT_843414 [Russula compacta]|nr:hypothetical protein BJV74DRAFT_843414 [Russula compacta]
MESTGQYSVSEVLLSSFFHLPSHWCPAFMYRRRDKSVKTYFRYVGQGPTNLEGPVAILNQIIFRILEGRTDLSDYLHFIG